MRVSISKVKDVEVRVGGVVEGQVGAEGHVAGIIDIGATWLTDIKFGICPSAFYLNREQCCWSSNETVIDISGNCSLW